MRKMNRTTIIIVIILVLSGGFLLLKNKTSNKQTANLQQAEKKLEKGLGLKEEKTTAPIYSKAVIDEDKCGKDAYFVNEKSTDFVKNYCQFLKEKGWRLVHQDYPDCQDIKSFGGGYNYQKGAEKISVSVIKYGEEGSCFWILGKK